ncbi:hypothetical protein D3C86_1222940 [compost metagenome]
MVLAVDLERERIILGGRALFLSGFRRFVADDIAERNRFAQWIDQHVELSLQVLVVEGDAALIKADRADIHHPARRLGVRVLRVEFESPVGAPVSQALQLGIRLGEIDTRDHYPLRQQCQG